MAAKNEIASASPRSPNANRQIGSPMLPVFGNIRAGRKVARSSLAAYSQGTASTAKPTTVAAVAAAMIAKSARFRSSRVRVSNTRHGVPIWTVSPVTVSLSNALPSLAQVQPMRAQTKTGKTIPSRSRTTTRSLPPLRLAPARPGHRTVSAAAVAPAGIVGQVSCRLNACGRDSHDLL